MAPRRRPFRRSIARDRAARSVATCERLGAATAPSINVAENGRHFGTASRQRRRRLRLGQRPIVVALVRIRLGQERVNPAAPVAQEEHRPFQVIDGLVVPPLEHQRPPALAVDADGQRIEHKRLRNLVRRVNEPGAADQIGRVPVVCCGVPGFELDRLVEFCLRRVPPHIAVGGSAQATCRAAASEPSSSIARVAAALARAQSDRSRQKPVFAQEVVGIGKPRICGCASGFRSMAC